ncbi:uncharacterized protein N7483_007379 [Penicillium malachiteum]|uniref:uncharacterized protein n=1 Tax=Penicillium malachiteum TaxID=1324776 RepID=UPI0025467C99|nr:uncharacterized protein N7483_007379 [Penicillium malachiteum]KAJ5726022.1 hypothetical protein N7483_007379 [Penicillium malachiteum]
MLTLTRMITMGGSKDMKSESDKGILARGLQVQYPGKSWEVIQRIGSLKVIAAHLEGIEDPLGELPNVNAIIHAYENGQLEWDDNASYWCQGKLIAGTSPFSWSDFRTLNTKENRGGGGFWVEGVFPLAPSEKAMRWESPTRNAVGTPEVRIGLRLDRTAREMELSQTDYTGMPFPVLLRRFIDDSAADFMTIGEVDMWELMGNEIEVATAPMGHLMGYSTIALADGRVAVMKILSVEVNMVGFDELRRPGLMLPDWTTIPCAVFETLRPWYHHMLLDGAGRLAGPWLRSKFYVGSAPEAPYPSLYAGSDVHDLFSMLPILPPGNRPGPLFRPPHMGVNWAVQPETGLFVPAPSIGGYRAVPPGTLQG